MKIEFNSDSNYERENLLLCCFCAPRKNNTTTNFLSHNSNRC